MRYAFAGDRQISLDILNFLLSKNQFPLALFVSEGINESHASKLIEISRLSGSQVFIGNEFKSDKSLGLLKSLELDYIFGVHFPYIIPEKILRIPKIGFLNLHPSFLPYNKGWHTPTWTILDDTPYGATLHFMSEALDEGDIIHQISIKKSLTDSADSLYNKVLSLEKIVFEEAYPALLSLNPERKKQNGRGSLHTKGEIEKIREIDLDEIQRVSDFLNKLRALKTNNENELPYFIYDGKKIGVKLEFVLMDK